MRKLLEFFPQVEDHKDGHDTFCPVCHDTDARNPHLLVEYRPTKNDADRWELFCRYGCRQDEILFEIGLTAQDLHLNGSYRLPEYNLTDAGNAERFIEKYRDRVRFCNKWRTWMLWNGKHWARDESNKVIEFGKFTVRGIYDEAKMEENEGKRKQIAKHATASESEKNIKSMISLAKSKVPISVDEFDTDKFLLNVRNGTINLRTGKLWKHRRGDYITKYIDINYDEDAVCPEWRKFLFKIFNGDMELCHFVQRAVGYSLTGITDERVLFILHGGGRNGKTTFVESIARLLNDYAMRTSSETLLMKRDGIPNDIARLRGARFVYASETEENRRLAESRIKDLTGGDRIAARFLFQDYFEFVPEFKLWLSTNHRPRVRDTSRAVWDRIRLIPFNVTLQDNEIRPRREIDAMFDREMSGMLRWAVEGAIKWQSEGLGLPDAVKIATAEYHDEEDQVKSFIDEKCTISEDATVDNTALWKAYNSYCDENNERPVSRRAFKQSLEGRGYVQKHSGRKFWEGIGLLHE